MSKDSIVKDLIVSMQGQEFYLPVYLLPISSAYLIPRATWLATLGPHVADYAYPKIKIYEAGKLVTLMSEKPKLPQQSHLHHFRRAQNTNAIYELFTIQWEEPEVPQDTWLTLPEDLEPNFAVLLDTYKSICDKHVGGVGSRGGSFDLLWLSVLDMWLFGVVLSVWVLILGV